MHFRTGFGVPHMYYRVGFTSVDAKASADRNYAAPMDEDVLTATLDWVIPETQAFYFLILTRTLTLTLILTLKMS
jgi:hypothetical protein